MRFIRDARRANCWFGEPDPVELVTRLSMGAIEVDSADPIFLGQVDIADASYNLEHPVEIRGYFGLAALPACLADVSEITGVPVKSNDLIVPCFRA
eukprot:14988762-Heterocapsa_arctica.AAC.1